MSYTYVVFPEAKKLELNNSLDLLNNTIKAALFESDVTNEPDPATDVYLSNVANSEVSGYTRATLASKAVTKDGDAGKFACGDLLFAGVTSSKVRHVILFKDTGDDATSPILIWFDRGSDKVLSNQNFRLVIPSLGLLRLI